jgi:preprotein translocase subunit SecG
MILRLFVVAVVIVVVLVVVVRGGAAVDAIGEGWRASSRRSESSPSSLSLAVVTVAMVVCACLWMESLKMGVLAWPMAGVQKMENA